MTIYSDSSILTEGDVKFLLNLLPNNLEPLPDIYLFENCQSVVSLIGAHASLFERYSLLKSIIQKGVFSTFNFKHNIIFIYLFNLPYKDKHLVKLHGAYCLFHEIRHHQQYSLNKQQFHSYSLNSGPYSQQWVEKDANQFAVRWMRKNQKSINEKFHLSHSSWDIRVNEHNRLRIVAI